MGLNSVNLDGRLVRDSEVRMSQAGKPYTNMRIAYDTWNSAKREREANFINVRVFKEIQLPKGQAVIVSGRLEIKEFEKDGQMRTYPQIIAFDCFPITYVKAGPPGEFAAAPQQPRVGTVVDAFGGTVQPPGPVGVPSSPPPSSTPSDDFIPF